MEAHQKKDMPMRFNILHNLIMLLLLQSKIILYNILTNNKMSEGELINARKAIENRNIFKQGIGGFSSKSINELFDVDNDGMISGVERDLMTSSAALNTLESISPIVAYAFNQENFMIQTGSYLTNEQKVMSERLVLAANKAMLIQRLIDDQSTTYREDKIERPAEIYYTSPENQLNTDNLLQDIAKRQFLSGAELNNNV